MPLAPPLPRAGRGDRASGTLPARIMSIEFTLNGQSVRLDEIDPTRPLLSVLREDFSLHGSRFGCGLEQCGACMVLIDGVPTQSCAREIATIAGHNVTTVEGLLHDGRPHQLQQAFLDEQAGQCGYCLSGILISAAALLAHNTAPSRAEVAAALDRNLCRCGVHNRIIRAVQRAGAAMAAGAGPRYPPASSTIRASISGLRSSMAA